MENDIKTRTNLKTGQELLDEIKRQEGPDPWESLKPILARIIGLPLMLLPLAFAADVESLVSLYAFMLAACFSLGFVVVGSTFFPGKIRFKTKLVTATGIFALFMVLVHVFVTKDKKPFGYADHWRFAALQSHDRYSSERLFVLTTKPHVPPHHPENAFLVAGFHQFSRLIGG